MGVALLALFVVLGGGALAATSFVGSNGKIRGCVSTDGQLTVLKPGKKCAKGLTAIAWNQKGPAGQNGQQGLKGDACLSTDPNCKGPKGDKGDACLSSDPNCKGPKGDKGDACLSSDPNCKGPKGDTGSPSGGAMLGRANGLTTVNQALSPSGSSTPVLLASEGTVAFLSPSTPIVASDLSAKFSVAPGSGNGRFLKVRVNGSSSGTVLCDVQDAETTCQSPAGATQTIPANSVVSMAATTGGSPAASDVQFGWRAGTP
jgi:hypothetical protein